jgi:hypothetical protein
VFSSKQIQGIEDYKDVPKVQEIKWDLDANTYEHFKSLGLMQDEPDPDDDIVSYIK